MIKQNRLFHLFAHIFQSTFSPSGSPDSRASNTLTTASRNVSLIPVSSHHALASMLAINGDVWNKKETTQSARNELPNCQPTCGLSRLTRKLSNANRYRSINQLRVGLSIETRTVFLFPNSIPIPKYRARKIFSLPVAEIFGPSPGAIFLVAFSFNLVAIVCHDSKV